jgi:hypothetical protein
MLSLIYTIGSVVGGLAAGYGILSNVAPLFFRKELIGLIVEKKNYTFDEFLQQTHQATTVLVAESHRAFRYDAVFTKELPNFTALVKEKGVSLFISCKGGLWSKSRIPEFLAKNGLQPGCVVLIKDGKIMGSQPYKTLLKGGQSCFDAINKLLAA